MARQAERRAEPRGFVRDFTGVPLRTIAWAKSKHLFFTALLYIVLIDIAFAFLLPVLYMVSTSTMSMQDFLDPGIHWVPRRVHIYNYVQAAGGLWYPVAFVNSVKILIPATIGQILSCGLAGYSFARFRFPGKEILFAFVLFSFIVPPQTIIAPLFVLMQNLGWMDTFLPFTVPAFFAHGLRGPLFVLIFRQFFKRQPYELEDAAYVDGCGPLRTFTHVMLPLARPAILVVFLFSMVWHWNQHYLPSMYLLSHENYTMPLRLNILGITIRTNRAFEIDHLLNPPLWMAGGLLVITPPLLLYLLAQRYFVESIERTGLVD